jgi:putative SOS response-associated peptidase YedK
MCGRYRLSRRKELLEEHFDADLGDMAWAPRFNIAPTQFVPVIRSAPSGKRDFSLLRWRLVPSWSADPSRAASMINARAETAATKPAFRDALKSRRCLIPADGFYEWQKLGKTKQPYCFETDKGGLFALAGIWESWSDPSAGTLETCSILTTSPNELAAKVHDRMPAILEPRFYDVWLNQDTTDARVALEVLTPFDAARMNLFPVSTRVSYAVNDDPECSAPIKLAQIQSRLF